MKHIARSPLMCLLVLLSIIVGSSAGTAQAMDKPRLEDNAGFFSADAVDKANQIIAQVKRDHGKDLYILTLAGVPEELKSQYRPDQKGQFFTRLAIQRAEEAKVNGVIVLIVRDPATVVVRVGKETIQQSFLQSDADQLQSILTSSFRKKEFDSGLLSGVEYVRDTLATSTRKSGGVGVAPSPAERGTDSSAGAIDRETNTTPAPAPRGGTNRSPLGGMGRWVCVGFAVLMVILLFRAMRSRAAQYSPQGGRYGAPADPNAPYAGQQYPGGYPQPGSGMGRGFLGGLLGGALGGYAYDRFMRRPNDPGAGSGGSGVGSAGSFDTPADTGDFSGGTDGGGSTGDFGGGDVGGGGGDFGGAGDGGGSSGDF